ncbi:MAG: hypothetical protein ACD_50C00338G0002 [uncultured bacterium]|nr:MAG: hypothetical protein ACD_50C00338G0002 [uncultured bacterium]
MELSEKSFEERIIEWGRRNLVILALFFLGLIFLGYGLISLLGANNSSDEIIFEAGKDTLSSDSDSEQGSLNAIVVDVAGSVLKPGVYRLDANSRVSDSLIAAGGLSENADRDWVAKNLNMAAKLIDGAKVYIPRVGEAVMGITSSTVNTSAAESIGGNSQININNASEDMLDSLPGVGPVTAEKIINGRPYSSIDELLSKKIVGSKVFGEIKEKITVY